MRGRRRIARAVARSFFDYSEGTLADVCLETMHTIIQQMENVRGLGILRPSSDLMLSVSYTLFRNLAQRLDRPLPEECERRQAVVEQEDSERKVRRSLRRVGKLLLAQGWPSIAVLPLDLRRELAEVFHRHGMCPQLVQQLDPPPMGGCDHPGCREPLEKSAASNLKALEKKHAPLLTGRRLVGIVPSMQANTLSIAAPLTIHHRDHGVPESLVRWALDQIKPSGFFLQTLRIPDSAPDLLNALYGPRAGDRPVLEARMGQRSADRPPSRLVDLPPRPTRLLTVIGTATPEGVVVFTAHGGPSAEREPGDPSLEGDVGARAASAAFWGQHALAGLPVWTWPIVDAAIGVTPFLEVSEEQIPAAWRPRIVAVEEALRGGASTHEDAEALAVLEWIWAGTARYHSRRSTPGPMVPRGVARLVGMPLVELCRRAKEAHAVEPDGRVLTDWLVQLVRTSAPSWAELVLGGERPTIIDRKKCSLLEDLLWLKNRLFLKRDPSHKEIQEMIVREVPSRWREELGVLHLDEISTALQAHQPELALGLTDAARWSLMGATTYPETQAEMRAYLADQLVGLDGFDEHDLELVAALLLRWQCD
jgi:hypothetical protein